MLEGYFEPVSEEIWAPFKGQPHCIGGRLNINKGKFLKFKKTKVALIGTNAEANETRKALYGLSWRFDNMEVADLGNLVQAKTEKDKQFALSEVVNDLVDQGMVVLILGSSPAYLYGQYRGYRRFKEPVEIVKVSPDIDLEPGSVLHQILSEKPGYLFNIDFLASQAYFVSEPTAAFLEKCHFENHRLGEIRANIDESEPILRSAHLMMFDMNAIRASDAPGTRLKSPNGLYSEEAARIARYAGISNKLTSAQFFGLEDTAETRSQALLAQMIWYFLDGVTSRFNDHPEVNHRNFLIYRHKLSGTGHELVFYKSRKSNRWWMEVPHPYEKQSYFIGCSYSDYQAVSADEMPDRWWRAYQRLM